MRAFEDLTLNRKSLMKTDAPPAFPSPTVKKIRKLSLAKRGRAHQVEMKGDARRRAAIALS